MANLEYLSSDTNTGCGGDEEEKHWKYAVCFSSTCVPSSWFLGFTIKKKKKKQAKEKRIHRNS